MNRNDPTVHYDDHRRHVHDDVLILMEFEQA